jgi:hypothetical protein
MKKRVKEEFDDDEETSTIGDIEDSAGMERCAVYNYQCATVPYNPVPELFNEPDRVFVALLLPLDARDPEVHVTEDCTHLKVAYRWPASIENMAVVLAGWEDAVKERFHPLATGFKKALNDSAKDLGNTSVAVAPMGSFEIRLPFPVHSESEKLTVVTELITAEAGGCYISKIEALKKLKAKDETVKVVLRVGVSFKMRLCEEAKQVKEAEDLYVITLNLS